MPAYIISRMADVCRQVFFFFFFFFFFTLTLPDPDMHCLCTQCRSGSEATDLDLHCSTDMVCTLCYSMCGLV